MGALTCLHGFLGSPADWDFLRAEWDVRAPEILPDRDLDDWGDELAPGGVLIGYSLGARLALHLLRRQAGRWRAAILVSANPGLESDAERTARRARDAAWAERFRRDEWETVFADWNAQSVFAGSVTPPRAAAAREAAARMLERWSLGRQRAFWDELPAWRLPVLWVAGERDAKFRALAERASSYCGRHVILPGCGHRVPWDDAAALRATIREFLEREVNDGTMDATERV